MISFFKLPIATAILLAALSAQVKAAPTPTLFSRHEGHDDSASAGTSTAVSDLVKNNALQAQQHNARFAALKESDSCNGMSDFHILPYRRLGVLITISNSYLLQRI
ncbi:hypothetical protein NMY22_g14032 [Coprinellus aureogranulatus]|nr:hypothetical protein NMY22_g14032 [Coprinellus aureogranulatus]